MWGNFCSIGVIIFVIRGFRASKYRSFGDFYFKVAFLDDVRSDSGVPRTPKTSIWHKRGCKTLYFIKVEIPNAAA